MKRPSFQFYPGDWQSNQKLRRCAHEEKGVWMDVLCLMHDSDEYGILRWPLADIARAVGVPVTVLISLWVKGVLKGAPCAADVALLSPKATIGETIVETNGETIVPTKALPYIHQAFHAGKKSDPVTLIPDQEGPLWYSSRMVLDEHFRNRRGSHGHKALEHPNHPANKGKPVQDSSPIVTIGETIVETNGDTIPPTIVSTPSSSSSSSSSCIKNISPEETPVLVASQEDKIFKLDLQQPNEPFIVLPLIGGEECEVFKPLLDELSTLYPAVDVAQEFRNMRAWLLTNPKERKTKAGIARFYNAWIAKNQNRSSTGPGKSRQIGDKLTQGKWGGFEEKNYREGTNPDGSF